MTERSQHHLGKPFWVVPGYIALHDKLTLTDKVVYGAMLTLAHKTGICFASHQRIGVRCMVPRETVSRSIRKLQEQNCLRSIPANEAREELAAKDIERAGKARFYRCLYRIEKARPKVVSIPKHMRNAS